MANSETGGPYPSPFAIRSSTFVRVRPMRLDEAEVVARHHQGGLPTAFLSQLGVTFLTRLYAGIAKSPYGFVFVAVDAGDRVVGFVSGAESVKSLYGWVLLRRGWLLAGLLIRHVVRWSTVRRVIELSRYPAQTGGDYPPAELLSIVVDPQMRGTGAATLLLSALLAEFRNRGLSRIKAVVGAQLDRANAYYVKHGFRLAGSICSHGAWANVYVIDTESR